MLNKKKALFFSFVTGFAVMVVELTAARIMAPILGSSVYTWTSVIGTILLGTALGNNLGGKMIDKRGSLRIGALFFWLAGVSVLCIPAAAGFTKNIALLHIPFWTAILFASIILFLVPSFFLGAVYPTILKFYLQNLSSLGKEAGLVSSLWSFGSIVGTFATGFVFIGYIGSSATLVTISLILSACSLLFFPEKKERIKFLILYCIIFFIILYVQRSTAVSSAAVVFQKESDYYTIRVADSGSLLSGKLRFLLLDSDSHSVESERGTLDIYPNFYPVFSIFNDKQVSDIAVIGGGSLAISENFKKYYPEAAVTTAEIDPLVTETAEKYFHTSPYVVRNTVAMDGRLFLSQSRRKFDVIFSDAYSSFISIPWHLATREFFQTAQSRLKDGGAFAINFISAKKGPSGAFYRSMLTTFSSVFDNYYVFNYGSDPEDIQNVVLVGVNSDKHLENGEVLAKLPSLPDGNLLKKHFDTTVDKEVSGMILTDDFAPTDRLMMPAVNGYFSKYVAFLKTIL